MGDARRRGDATEFADGPRRVGDAARRGGPRPADAVGHPGDIRPLRDALRREADTVSGGPAPVDAVLLRGRAARRRRNAALAGAAAAVVAVLAVVPLAGREAALVPVPVPPATVAPVTPRPEPVRTVAPYETVDIGHGRTMALLPDGEQNHVAGHGDIRDEVDAARDLAGENIRPDSLSGGRDLDPGRPVMFSGVFRTGEVPAAVEVRIDSGERLRAGMLRLPGDPDWGTYYAFGPEAAGNQNWTVTAYAADGRVLVETRFDQASGG
ncbi:hypothetical protein ACFU9F_19000 [Streptomyces zhihengii]|uniref:hypothetical protein n=1 Tax=Streptomyces zhihengii TaxID=1818004 RepID=UPI00367645AF